MTSSKGIRKKRLYQCDECKSRRFVSRIELDRAAKPKCNGCGSSRLEIVSDEGRDEEIARSHARVTGDFAAGSAIPGGYGESL